MDSWKIIFRPNNGVTSEKRINSGKLNPIDLRSLNVDKIYCLSI
jgi:hypothetical protein